MSVQVLLKCCGCDAEQLSEPLHSTYEDVGPTWVRVKRPSIEDALTNGCEGWVTFDPYTAACYCPACWAMIVGPKEERCWGR